MADTTAWLRSYAIKLWHPDEGREADWPVIAQALFTASFSVIDEATANDPRADIVLRAITHALATRGDR